MTNTTNGDDPIRLWIQRVKSALPAPSDTEACQPYTLVVSRRHEYWTFTMVVNASDPVTAIRHATAALRVTPIPPAPDFDGVGSFEVVDVYKGGIDLNEIEAAEGSLAHLLPHK